MVGTTVDPTPLCVDARTGNPTPVELTNSARVPSIGFWCPDAMNDPPVSSPVVKLTSMTQNASPATLTFDTTVLPPPCTIQPCLPPPEPPPIDVVPGEGHRQRWAPAIFSCGVDCR